MIDDVNTFPGRRVGAIAAIIAVVSSVPVALFSDSASWLIAIPIIAGVVIVVSWEFARGLTRTSEDISAFTVDAHVFDQNRLPPLPDGFIPLPENRIKQFESLIISKEKVLLRGQSGSGKTTFAAEMCRRYMMLNGQSPIKRVPIFVSLSKIQRSNGLASMFVDQIALNVSNDYSGSAHKLAMRMIKRGRLLLVIDDLDYLDKRGHEEIEKFIKRASLNSFVCIMSEKPDYPFLKGFDEAIIETQSWIWKYDEIKTYIHNRIDNEPRRKELVEHLGDWEDRANLALTPLQANDLVDAYLEGSVFKLIELTDEQRSREFDYETLDNFMPIMFKSADATIDYKDRVNEFGKLALNLLKEGSRRFDLENAKINADHMKGLTPKLFQQQGDSFFFAHGAYQIFLTAKYIAWFWPEAKVSLRDAAARTLIWKPVYDSARRFMSEDQAADLEETFKKLAQSY